MLSLTGDVGMMPVTDVVAWIANRRLTCNLTVKRRSNESGFLVRNGVVWQARSSDPREYLGQHLINFGYIDEDQLQKAFETQQETHVPLGRVLVMVDAVSPEQLARVLLFKTRESLLEAMCWNDGTFRVNNDVPEERDLDCDVPIELKEVHSEGVARGHMWQEIRKVFPSDATRCEVLVKSDEVVVSQFDARLLDLLRSGGSIGETSLELRSMDFQLYARLYDLYNRKMVEPKLQSGIFDDDGDELVLGEVESFEINESDIVETAAPPGTQKPVKPAVDDDQGRYRMPRAAMPDELPGVAVPAEATDPHAALRVALAGRNWREALILADRILEVDAQNAEAQAARRVADVQVKKQLQENAEPVVNIDGIPLLTGARHELAKEHLTSKERYVLSRIDGRRSLQQIAAVSPIQRDELLRIIEGFVKRGTVTLS